MRNQSKDPAVEWLESQFDEEWEDYGYVKEEWSYIFRQWVRRFVIPRNRGPMMTIKDDDDGMFPE